MDNYRKYRYSLRRRSFSNMTYQTYITESIAYMMRNNNMFHNQLYDAVNKFSRKDYGNVKLSAIPNWGKYETCIEPIFINNDDEMVTILFQFELPEKYTFEKGYGLCPPIDIEKISISLSNGIYYVINDIEFRSVFLKSLYDFRNNCYITEYKENRYGFWRMQANWKLYETKYGNIIIYRRECTYAFFLFEIGWIFKKFCSLEEKYLNLSIRQKLPTMIEKKKIFNNPKKYNFGLKYFFPLFNRQKDYGYINIKLENFPSMKNEKKN